MWYLKSGKMWMILLIAPLALVLSGCGGVQATRSVSPASFFLPTGFLQAEPLPNTLPIAEVTVPEGVTLSEDSLCLTAEVTASDGIAVAEEPLCLAEATSETTF